MASVACDVCPERFPEPTHWNQGTAEERKRDHMLDNHLDYLIKERDKAKQAAPSG